MYRAAAYKQREEYRAQSELRRQGDIDSLNSEELINRLKKKIV